MRCAQVKYTGHATRRMFERGITQIEVAGVLLRGELVEDYPNEQPLPSRLLLAEVGGRSLHVVVARNPLRGSAWW